MRFNVAQLLLAPVGTKRPFLVDEPFGVCDEVAFRGRVTGQGHLLRVNHGIVVRGDMTVLVELECCRCLEPFTATLVLELNDRFVPSVDVLTGRPFRDPLEDRDDEDVYTINDVHEIDLHEAIRQQAVMSEPMQPLHDPACKGLCPHCGVNRNKQVCDCAVGSAIDPRLTVFQALRSHQNGT